MNIIEPVSTSRDECSGGDKLLNVGVIWIHTEAEDKLNNLMI